MASGKKTRARRCHNASGASGRGGEKKMIKGGMQGPGEKDEKKREGRAGE